MTEPASSPPAVQPPVGVGHASSFKDPGHDPTTETSASRHGTHLAISAIERVERVRIEPPKVRVVRSRHRLLLRRLASTSRETIRHLEVCQPRCALEGAGLGLWLGMWRSRVYTVRQSVLLLHDVLPLQGRLER